MKYKFVVQYVCICMQLVVYSCFAWILLKLGGDTLMGEKRGQEFINETIQRQPTDAEIEDKLGFYDLIDEMAKSDSFSAKAMQNFGTQSPEKLA